MEMILAILRKKAPQFGMPKHPRTLVNTNKKATGIRKATGGTLWYNGLRHSLGVALGTVAYPELRIRWHSDY
ncbi:AGAP000409-PA-like protein [Anopheles sinensis]|uniref:AGAP000409-PA-like protein n=1 Tax=Anopheles sinensis TaxID=74873 RepID=A0A084V9T0_ANOSI|nr:AGAP000409-PA-like protein [Anopheles sinensis]